MSETKSTEQTETDTDTEALIRYEYRRKAFCATGTLPTTTERTRSSPIRACSTYTTTRK